MFSLKSQNVFSAGQDKKETWRSFHLLVWISLLPSVIAVLAPGVQDSGSLVSSAATYQPINHLFPPRAALTARLCCSVPHLQATLLFFGVGGYFACYYFCHVRVFVCLQCPLSLPCEFTFWGPFSWSDRLWRVKHKIEGSVWDVFRPRVCRTKPTSSLHHCVNEDREGGRVWFGLQPGFVSQDGVRPPANQSIEWHLPFTERTCSLLQTEALFSRLIWSPPTTIFRVGPLDRGPERSYRCLHHHLHHLQHCFKPACESAADFQPSSWSKCCAICSKCFVPVVESQQNDFLKPFAQNDFLKPFAHFSVQLSTWILYLCFKSLHFSWFS